MLVYGLDAGLVAERAAALVEKFARQGKGDIEIVRLDDRDLAEDPARIEVELRTRPMFAAGKASSCSTTSSGRSCCRRSRRCLQHPSIIC